MTIFVLILFWYGVAILDLVELKTYDLRLLSRGVRKPSPQVVLAVIDEKSLNAEGRWPWPRAKIARLIDLLSQDGAKVIGFDIGFLEPDKNTNLEFIDGFERKIAQDQPETELYPTAGYNQGNDLSNNQCIDDHHQVLPIRNEKPYYRNLDHVA